MRNVTEIEPTERTVLACECGERLVLLGSRDDWISEERTSFECGSCGALVLLDLGDRAWQGWPEDDREQAEPWVGSSDGSKDATVRRLIQELKAANMG